MVPPDSARDLPLLEILDAAPDYMIPADRVAAVGAVLHAKGFLRAVPSGSEGGPPGTEYVWGFHRAARYGGARRVRNTFALTAAGQQLLRENGIEASADARREVEELVRRSRQDLLAEADRLLASP